MQVEVEIFFAGDLVVRRKANSQMELGSIFSFADGLEATANDKGETFELVITHQFEELTRDQAMARLA